MGKAISNCVDNLSARGEHAKDRHCATVDHGDAINQHFEFTITPPNHFHLRAQLTPQPRRHTDGVQP